jgi:hypothetical protein
MLGSINCARLLLATPLHVEHSVWERVSLRNRVGPWGTSSMRDEVLSFLWLLLLLLLRLLVVPIHTGFNIIPTFNW